MSVRVKFIDADKKVVGKFINILSAVPAVDTIVQLQISNGGDKYAYNVDFIVQDIDDDMFIIRVTERNLFNNWPGV